MLDDVGYAHVVAVALFAVGCGQELLVRGTVDSVACDAGAAPTRAVLADATVSVQCADAGPPMLRATTDARGRFSVVPARSVPMSCTVEIAKRGYATRRYAVKDLCVNKFVGTAPGSANDEPSCAMFGVTASLAPEATP